MKTQLNAQKVNVSTLAFDRKHLFSDEASEEYKYAIKLASNSVVDFLRNNKKPFSGILPK